MIYKLLVLLVAGFVLSACGGDGSPVGPEGVLSVTPGIYSLDTDATPPETLSDSTGVVVAGMLQLTSDGTYSDFRMHWAWNGVFTPVLRFGEYEIEGPILLLNKSPFDCTATDEDTLLCEGFTYRREDTEPPI